MKTNFLACAFHHVRWLEKFPAKLALVAKLKVAAGLACNIFKLSNEVTESENHPIWKCWSASLKQRETVIAKNPPTALMGDAAIKRTVVMYFPSLIQRACNPQDKLTSHPYDIASKINEAAVLGFKDLNIYELNAWDFSTQCLCD